MSRVISLTLAFLACAAAANASADDWYIGVQADMGSVEQASDQTIWLLNLSGNTVTVTGQSGPSSTCTIDQIHLIPPAGEASAWLAMVLTAIAAGDSIRVYGTCVSSDARIDASRMVVDYLYP